MTFLRPILKPISAVLAGVVSSVLGMPSPGCCSDSHDCCCRVKAKECCPSKQASVPCCTPASLPGCAAVEADSNCECCATSPTTADLPRDSSSQSPTTAVASWPAAGELLSPPSNEVAYASRYVQAPGVPGTELLCRWLE